jgi:hypothetical protein
MAGLNEEEYLAKLLEEQFVAEDAPPDPWPGVIQDVFFNVDNETGTVGIGTSQAIGARVHIVSRDPFPAVRIIQKGTGDVLLIDNKDLADQNDPPRIPYFNLKNDGKIGIGTTTPLSEIHLITDKEASNILIGDLPGSRATTDSGMTFSGLANTVTSGLFTEVDGLLVSLAANVSQAGVVDTSRVGGVVRIDTRRKDEFGVSLDIPGDYNAFTVKGVPIGTDFTGEYNVLTANLDTGDINIAPQKGEVYVGAYSSTTSVGIATTAIDEQYRLYVYGNTGIAGTLSLPDDSKITVGISSDLSIYHDPVTNNSYILENNPAGNLVIAGDNIEFKDTSLTENYAVFTTNGAVELYYDNVKKLETTPDGVFIGALGFSTTGIISGPQEIVIDPAVVGDDTGIVRIKGDLYVDGGTTQIYSTVVTIADIQVGIATTISTSNALLNDAGISIGIGAVQKKFTYDFLSDSLKSTENLNLAIDKVYKIDGNSVLSISTVGTSVTTSYLQKVGNLIDLTVTTLTTTRDLNVTGFATIANITGTALSITNLEVGVATVGYATITATNIGVATVGFSSIRNLIVPTTGIATIGFATIGIATIDNATITNLKLGTADGTPFGQVGILTIGALSPFGQFGGGFIGSEAQVLVATGSTYFNNTGIGISWSEFSLAAIGGTTGIAVTVVDPALDLREFYLPGVPRDEIDAAIGGVAIAATVYVGGLRYSPVSRTLSDLNGNFRAIPRSSNTTATIVKADVGKHLIFNVAPPAGLVQIQNGVFEVGDAITVVNALAGGVGSFNINMVGGGTLRFAGSNVTGSRTLNRYGIATMLCIEVDPVTGDNTFIISGPALL